MAKVILELEVDEGTEKSYQLYLIDLAEKLMKLFPTHLISIKSYTKKDGRTTSPQQNKINIL